MSYPCVFDKLLPISVPHILEIIFFSLDYDSYKRCSEVNSTWKELLTCEQFKKRAKSVYHEGMLLDVRELLCFAENGKAEKVSSLLSIGMNPDCQSFPWGGITPLNWAATNGHTDVVKLLLRAGADPNIADLGRETPLSEASRKGHKYVVKLLLEARAEPHTTDDFGRTPLYWAARYGHTEVVKLLLDPVVKPNTPDASGRTPLYWAAIKGHTDVVKLLLKNGADPNIADDWTDTPLYAASREGHKDVAKMLLEAEADPNTKATLKEQHYIKLPVMATNYHNNQ